MYIRNHARLKPMEPPAEYASLAGRRVGRGLACALRNYFGSVDCENPYISLSEKYNPCYRPSMTIRQSPPPRPLALRLLELLWESKKFGNGLFGFGLRYGSSWFLKNPEVIRWLGGVEPPWSLLIFESITYRTEIDA